MKRHMTTNEELIAFADWMNKDRLEGFYVKAKFMAHASKELGFQVRYTALDSWLRLHKVAMPSRPLPVQEQLQLTLQAQVDRDLSVMGAVLLGLIEKRAVPEHMQGAVLEMVQRRAGA